MLNTLAGLYAQPFDWGFWDERTFYARPLERQPTNPARVVVVGGGHPGLVSWDVQEADDDTPDYVCVYFGNVDNASYPPGWVRRLYVPHDPDDTAHPRTSMSKKSDGDFRIGGPAASCASPQAPMIYVRERDRWGAMGHPRRMWAAQ